MQNIKFKISSPTLLILLACCLLLSGCSYSGGSSSQPTVSDRMVHQTRLRITDCKAKSNSDANGNVSVKGLSKVKDGYGIPGAYMKDKSYTGQNWSKGDAERGKGIFTSEDFVNMGGCSGDEFSKQNYAIAARWEYVSYQVASGKWPGWSVHGCTDGLVDGSYGSNVDNDQYAWVVKQKVLVYCPKTKKSVVCIVGDGKSNPNWGGNPLAAMAGLSYKAQEALGLSRGQCLSENIEMEMWWCDDENATPGPSTMSLDGNASSSDSVSSETASNLNTAADAGTTTNDGIASGSSSKGEQIKIPEAIKDKQHNDVDFYGGPYSTWFDSTHPDSCYQNKVKLMWEQEGSKDDCGLPTYKGRYGVVLSSQMAAAGDYVDIVYTDGKVLSCFVDDVKSDQDGGYVYEGKTWGDKSGDGWKCLEWILSPKGLNDKGNETVKNSKISYCFGAVDYIVKYGNMVKGDDPPDGVASGNSEQDDECGGSKSSESSSVIGSGLQGAINWAKKNALDVNLGYSMNVNERRGVMDESLDDKPRNGDCSAFVYAALVRGGGFTDIKEATGGAPFGTSGMTDTLTKCGWEKHELTDVSELKPGDVLWVHQVGGKQHTALYCEKGGVIAEESSPDSSEQRGDQLQKIDENGYDSVGECKYWKSESYIKSEFTHYFRYTGSGSGNDSSKSK